MPYNITGDSIAEGTYEGGLLVNQNIKQTIEAGSAGNFFHFTPVEGSDSYTMTPRMPEYGSLSQDGVVFRMRVNNNRLVKGIANQFLSDDGSLDYAKGFAFLNELDARLGLSEAPVSLEALRSGVDARMHGLDWLATTLRIPATERGDFRNFAEAMFFNHEESRIAPYMGGNFSLIWGGYIAAGLALGDESLREQLSADTGMRERLQLNLREQEKASAELLRYAHMDPETEMALICPTECSGSLHSNRLIWDYANNADILMGKAGKSVPPTSYSVNLEARDQENRSRLETEVSDARSRLDNWVFQHAQDGDSSQNRQLSALSDTVADAQKAVQHFDDTLGERKWDQHVATHIGSFTAANGKTYQLTLEAFAPEADSFMHHPGMTDAVSIGIFENEENFRKHYFKNAHIPADGITEDFCLRKQKAKEEQILQLEKNSLFNEIYQPLRDFSPYAERAYLGLKEDYHKFSIGEEWENNRNQSGYKPVMGSRGYTTNELEYEFKNDLRNAIMLESRIPDAHRDNYRTLVNTLDQIMERAEAYGKAKLNFNGVSSLIQAEHGSKELLNRSYLYTGELEEKDIDLRMARTAARSILTSALNGGEQVNHINNEEKEALTNFLSGSGASFESLVDMAKTLNGKLLPINQVRMDIQAPEDQIANDFITAAHASDMSLRAREFAVHNFDAAFSTVFPKSMLKTDDHRIFDDIYINGESAGERFRRSHMQYLSSEDKKIEIMKHITDNERVDFAVRDEKNLSAGAAASGAESLYADHGLRFVPVNVSSDIPLLASRFLRKAPAPEMDPAAQLRSASQLEAPASLSGAALYHHAPLSADPALMRASGASADHLLITEQQKNLLSSANPLLGFQPQTMEDGETRYRAQLRMPEYVYSAEGQQISFRQNYNYLLRGMSQMLLNGHGEVTPATAERAGLFAQQAQLMFSESRDPRNPAAAPDEVAAYRDQWLADQLNIPGNARVSFGQFQKEFFLPGSSDALLGNSFLHSFAEFSERIAGSQELEKQIGSSVMKSVHTELTQTSELLRSLAAIDPVESRRAFLPLSEGAGFLNKIQSLSAYPHPEIKADLLSAGNQGQAPGAYAAATLENRLITVELPRSRASDYLNNAPFSDELQFGVYGSRKDFTRYQEAMQNTEGRMTGNEYTLYNAGMEASARAANLLAAPCPDAPVLSGSISNGLYQTLAQNIMQTPEEKANTAMWALEELTGAKILGNSAPDLSLVRSALSRVCLNGVPFSRNTENGLNPENLQSSLVDFTDRLTDYLNIQNHSADHLSVLSDGKLESVCYNPPEPTAPRTSVHFFSSGKRKMAHQLEVQDYEEAQLLSRQWEERNTLRREECRKLGKAQPAEKNRICFEELQERNSSFKAAPHKKPVDRTSHRMPSVHDRSRTNSL